MSLRVGWISPFSPQTGVGSFSFAVTEAFPEKSGTEWIDLTVIHPAGPTCFKSRHRSMLIEDTDNFRAALTLFDVLVFNLGNNREHHGEIINLMRRFPGVVICHDFVYQHVLADRALRSGNCFSDFVALASLYRNNDPEGAIRRSRIASRNGRIRFTPWDNSDCAGVPMSEVLFDLGSALCVHSRFALRFAEANFAGPVLQLGMPCDQKSNGRTQRDVTGGAPDLKQSFYKLVSFGHIQPTKCLELVLEALAGDRELRSKVRFTIAGFANDAAYLQSLRERVRETALTACVDFELDVSERRLAELSEAADAFVNLRKPNTEGASASLIEQLMFGKPVIVLDSGCYAEIPDDAALKLPLDAKAHDLRAAIMRVVAEPVEMRAIGLSGRRWAEQWSCSSYANAFVAFLIETGDLLRRRSRVLADALLEPELDRRDHRWLERLAQARRALFYFDRHLLALEPAFVLERTTSALCEHVAEAVLGLVAQPSLVTALEQLLAPLSLHRRYWQVCFFYFAAEAVFAADKVAEDRLRAFAPCLDPAIWSVLEHLPTQQFVQLTALLLSNEPAHSPPAISEEENDGFPRRLLLEEALERLPRLETNLLRAWIGQRRWPAVNVDLPVIAERCEWTVGSERFCAATSLSGFYRQEPDHVWARGRIGFLGFRRGASIKRIELFVQQLHATPTASRTVNVTDGYRSVQLEVQSQQPCWIELDLAEGHGQSEADLTWIRISTDYAAPPPRSSDPRALGVALFKIRFVTAADVVAPLPMQTRVKTAA